MLKIYGLYTPHFFKTLWTAEELGLNYQHVPVDLTKQENKKPEHLMRHPFGKVPVIEHDGRFVFESCTIMRYMANVAPTNLYPKEAFARAQVEQWMDYFSFQAGRWCSAVWFEKCIAPKFFNRASEEKMVNEFTNMLNTDMPVIDSHLSKNNYFGGKEFTIADINAFTLMMCFKDAGFNFNYYPNFVKWFETVKTRSALTKLKEFYPVKNF